MANASISVPFFLLLFSTINLFIMKKEKKMWPIVLIVLGLLAPHLITAQQDSIKSFDLDEVVITATKFPKSRSETGKVVTIIDSDILQRSAGKDLSQLLNEQSGLMINGANSNPGKDKSTYLRGAKSEYTVFLIDGIPVSDPSGAGGAFDPRMFSLDQLERIEILKGSQSTLYGSDAIAGVINLITKKEGNKPFGGSTSIGFGSFGMLKGSASLQGSTSVADYHVGYSHMSADGISEAKDINNVGGFDKDGFAQNSLNASLGLKIVPSLTLTPFFRYTDYKGDFDGGSFTDDNSSYTSTLINPGFSSKYNLAKGAINFLYGYNSTDRKFDGPFGPTSYKGRFGNADLFFNYDLSNRLQLLTGINYQNLKMVDASLPVEDPDAQLVSPYVSLFVHNAGGFALELGGRYNHHSKYGSNSTFSINPSYSINHSTKIFLNYSTGFKAPTLQQLYGAFGPNENLKPERSASSEAGLEFLVNNKLETRLVFFNRAVEDIIIYTYASGNINLNEQNDFGFELEPSFKISDKVHVKAYYSFVDGKVTTKENGKDSTYFNLFRRPKHTLGLNVGVQANSKLFISLNARTFSERKDLFFNPANFYTAEQVNLDAYVLVDVYAEYKMITDRLNLFIDLRNILNRDYTEIYGYNTMGINLNAGLSFRF
ncbi:TonB-dependent receptor [Flammeovirgaceae bacterium]